jgi:hypothetical protein
MKVSLLALACLSVPGMLAALPLLAAQSAQAAGTPHYAGSRACQPCHATIYARWEKTPMANVVRDPRQHPEAILADFDHAPSFVNFTPHQIAFVYGSIWKQNYFTKA